MEYNTDTVIFSFGRMNPPTPGHVAICNRIVAESKKRGAAHAMLALSVTSGNSKNPINVQAKRSLLHDMLSYNTNKILQIYILPGSMVDWLRKLNTEIFKFKKIVFVCGTDRAEEYRNIFHKYNGIEFYFEEWEVVEVDRAETENVSSTNVRKAVRDGDIKSLMSYYPDLSPLTIMRIYDHIRWADQSINTLKKRVPDGQESKEEAS